MKTFGLLTCIVLLFGGINAGAKCGTDCISIWPFNPEIRKTSIFRIDGYGHSVQGIVEKLGKEYRIYLVSGDEEIECFQSATFHGDDRVNQVILKPCRNLVLGRKYVFECRDKMTNSIDSGAFVHALVSKFKSRIWTVVSENDENSPKWASQSQHLRGAFEKYGCGPELLSIFSFNVIDASEVMAKAVVKNMREGTTTAFCLSPSNNEISVGRRMCGGPFDLFTSKDFEVEFTLIDASGNETPWKGPPIKFQSPYKSSN